MGRRDRSEVVIDVKVVIAVYASYRMKMRDDSRGLVLVRQYHSEFIRSVFDVQNVLRVGGSRTPLCVIIDVYIFHVHCRVLFFRFPSFFLTASRRRLHGGLSSQQPAIRVVCIIMVDITARKRFQGWNHHHTWFVMVHVLTAGEEHPSGECGGERGRCSGPSSRANIADGASQRRRTHTGRPTMCCTVAGRRYSPVIEEANHEEGADKHHGY